MKKIALLIMALLITVSTCIFAFAKSGAKEEVQTTTTELEEGASGTEEVQTTTTELIEDNSIDPKASNLIIDEEAVYGSAGTWDRTFGISSGYDYYRVYYENNASTTAIITIEADNTVQHTFKVSGNSDRTYRVKKAISGRHLITISGKNGSVVKGFLSIRQSDKPSY